MDDKSSGKMGINAAWSMAVGGMIGGGIFSVLGVIVAAAGDLSWLSFILAGLIALATAVSYSGLTNKFKEGGGAFTYIKDIHHKGLAGSLSWLLIAGYTLTISVYAFTFGHYLANLFGIGSWLPRVSAVGIILLFLLINLRKVSETAWLEIFIVWGKLVILLAIAGAGFWHLKPELLVDDFSGGNVVNALTGAATIFMAYEGFQLIVYDYDDMKEPEKTIKKAEMRAVLTVILVYIVVSIGTIMLIGKEAIINGKEVAIAVAGQKAFGMTGLILATIGALFSTGSAINSTLFSTSRLARKVANDGELPSVLRHENRNGVPDRSIVIIGAAGAALSIFGSLSDLVEAASFIFLITFGTVNLIACFQLEKNRFPALLGFLGTLAAAGTLLYKFVSKSNTMLITISIIIALTVTGRKIVYSVKKRTSILKDH